MGTKERRSISTKHKFKQQRRYFAFGRSYIERFHSFPEMYQFINILTVVMTLPRSSMLSHAFKCEHTPKSIEIDSAINRNCIIQKFLVLCLLDVVHFRICSIVATDIQPETKPQSSYY